MHIRFTSRLIFHRTISEQNSGAPGPRNETRKTHQRDGSLKWRVIKSTITRLPGPIIRNRDLSHEKVSVRNISGSSDSWNALYSMCHGHDKPYSIHREQRINLPKPLRQYTRTIYTLLLDFFGIYLGFFFFFCSRSPEECVFNSSCHVVVSGTYTRPVECDKAGCRRGDRY